MNLNKIEAIVLALAVGIVAALSDAEMVAAIGLSAGVVKAISSVCVLIVGALKPVLSKKQPEAIEASK